MQLPYLLLCRTDDPDVKATWRALDSFSPQRRCAHDLHTIQHRIMCYLEHLMIPMPV